LSRGADRRHRTGAAFRVADISRDDLLDITLVRTAIEIEAIRLAIAGGDDAWEAGIVSALHQMRRHIERTGDEFREGAGGFSTGCTRGFHTALLASLWLKAPAGRAIPISMTRPIATAAVDDALVRQRQEIRPRAPVARRTHHRP